MMVILQKKFHRLDFIILRYAFPGNSDCVCTLPVFPAVHGSLLQCTADHYRTADVKGC